MTNPTRAHLLEAVRKVTEALTAAGYGMKRRDRREPGRNEKEESELRLEAAVSRHFRRQAKRARELLMPYTKVIAPPPTLFDELFEDDDDFIADLIRELTAAIRHGINLFGQATPIQIDWSLTNKRAAEWARQYAYDLVKGIDATTRSVLRSVVSAFVETPGMTIGDVMAQLPFDEKRAQLVATSEITRAYAQANQQAGEDLKKEFPDVRVIKTWFTNQDDLVCDICGPLDGQQVEIDKPFIHPVSKEEYFNPGDPHPGDRCWTETTTALAEL